MRLVRVKEPAQPGKAIQAKWTTRHELAKLRALIVKAKKQGDLRTWRRGKAVRDYINGKKVLAIVAELEVVRGAYKASAFADARIVPYLDPIVTEIADADLVVSRAGAMTIGELAAVGRAAILIPFAAATNNHQELNARVVERAGGAIVITEAQLRPERLALAIAEVINDSERTARMGSAARSLAAPQATKTIVDLLEKIVKTE